MEPLPVRVPSGSAAAARQQRLALLQPLALAHLQLRQPQPLALLQQVRAACVHPCKRSYEVLQQMLLLAWLRLCLL